MSRCNFWSCLNSPFFLLFFLHFMHLPLAPSFYWFLLFHQTLYLFSIFSFIMHSVFVIFYFSFSPLSWLIFKTDQKADINKNIWVTSFALCYVYLLVKSVKNYAVHLFCYLSPMRRWFQGEKYFTCKIKRKQNLQPLVWECRGNVPIADCFSFFPTAYPMILSNPINTNLNMRREWMEKQR